MLRKLPIIIAIATLASCGGKETATETAEQETKVAVNPNVKAEEFNPESIKLNDAAAALIKSSQIDSAMMLLDQAIALDTNFYPAHGNKIKIYIRKKDLTNAVNECEIILSKKPDLAETWTFAGMIYDKLGNTEKSSQYFENSIKLLDERIANPELQQNSMSNRFNRAYAMILSGKEQEGKAEMQKLKDEGMDPKTVDNYLKWTKQIIIDGTLGM